MNYYCSECKTVHIKEDLKIELEDGSFTAPFGDLMETHKQFGEEYYCPDCGEEVEEHIEKEEA